MFDIFNIKLNDSIVTADYIPHGGKEIGSITFKLGTDDLMDCKPTSEEEDTWKYGSQVMAIINMISDRGPLPSSYCYRSH